jgi:hypothetical protein
MATITFDTYDFVQTLKDAGIQESQAKAIADGLKKIDFEHMTSKRDLLEQKVDLIKWMIGLMFIQAGLIVAITKLTLN